tara:strand:- start:248 stop:556 length:309 start_codon:yes stop_codon:yes gene_type:complete
VVALVDLITPQVIEVDNLTLDLGLRIVNCLELKVVVADMDMVVTHQHTRDKVAPEVVVMALVGLVLEREDMDKVFLEEMVQDLLIMDHLAVVAVEVLEEWPN